MKEEILKFFKGDVEDSDEILKTYSHDASLFEVRPRFVLFPKDSNDVKNLVKWAHENKNRYQDPEKNKGWDKLSITARSAGTCMSGGPLNESIILDFTRYMNKLVARPSQINNFLGFSGRPHEVRGAQPDQLEKHLSVSSIVVQPGMYYRDFEKITLEKGMILPCYTASKSLNAMGGMFGNNSAGEKTLKYGKMEDYILESKVVFEDGNEYIVKPLSQKELQNKISQNDFEGNLYKKVYELLQKNSEEIKKAKPKVHKNSAGYYLWNVVNSSVLKNSSGLTLPGVPGGTHTVQNSSEQNYFDLNKLLVGSQGTLGIVTEMTLKLVPNPKYSKLVVLFLNNTDSLGRLVDEILQFNPETLETYDDKTMKLAVRFFPDFLKNKGFIGMMKFMWSFLPELWMMITGGFPKLILLVEFAGENEEEVQRQCEKLKNKLNFSAKGGPASGWNLKTHITKSEAESEKYWDIRRESFALLRKHVRGMRTAPFIDDIIVRPEFLPKFLPELNQILGKYDITFTLAGHAGDGNFHIIPLMDFNRADTIKIITELSDKVYNLVLKYHGSITAEHNDGIIRTPYLEKMYGAHIYQLFKETKDIFDSKNIFNPGKKVPSALGAGTKEFLISHIIKPDHPIQDHRI